MSSRRDAAPEHGGHIEESLVRCDTEAQRTSLRAREGRDPRLTSATEAVN